MAKRRSPNAVLEETADSFALLEPAAEPPKAAPPAEVSTAEARITVPLRANPTPRYTARHVDLQLDALQSVTLTHLVDALDHAGVRLKTTGRRIASAADGLRWLLDQIALDAE